LPHNYLGPASQTHHLPSEEAATLCRVESTSGRSQGRFESDRLSADTMSVLQKQIPNQRLGPKARASIRTRRATRESTGPDLFRFAAFTSGTQRARPIGSSASSKNCLAQRRALSLLVLGEIFCYSRTNCTPTQVPRRKPTIAAHFLWPGTCSLHREGREERC
jgi:hypothetical protein